MLIANTKNPLSMKIRISMETGIRPVELYNLHTKDINLETRKLYPTTAKHGSAHVFGT
jgi:integrase